MFGERVRRGGVHRAGGRRGAGVRRARFGAAETPLGAPACAAAARSARRMRRGYSASLRAQAPTLHKCTILGITTDYAR